MLVVQGFVLKDSFVPGGVLLQVTGEGYGEPNYLLTFPPFFAEAEITERESPWSKFDEMSLDEKRKLYRCGKDFVTLDSILPWSEYLRENADIIFRKIGTVLRSLSLTLRQLHSFFHVKPG